MNKRNEQYSLIRRKCIEVNPSIDPSRLLPSPRPIRLADVLLAITEGTEVKQQLTKGYFSGDRINSFEGNILDAVAFWDLRKDDLTKQGDDCLQFLSEVLK